MSEIDRRDFWGLGTMATVGLAAGCAPTSTGERSLTPGLVVVNGDVLTQDDANPRAEAFAIQNERFVAVGSSDDVRNLASASTPVIDAEQATIVPGFIDAHSHPSGAGLNELRNVNTNLGSMSPHVHALVSRGGWDREGTWVPVPYVHTKAAELLFRHKVITFLKEEGLLSGSRHRSPTPAPLAGLPSRPHRFREDLERSPIIPKSPPPLSLLQRLTIFGIGSPRGFTAGARSPGTWTVPDTASLWIGANVATPTCWPGRSETDFDEQELISATERPRGMLLACLVMGLAPALRASRRAAIFSSPAATFRSRDRARRCRHHHGSAAVERRRGGALDSDEETIQRSIATLTAVTERYFGTMGIPLLAGRLATRAEIWSGAPIAVVSQSVADRLWPGADAIGRRLRHGVPGEKSPALSADRPWLEVVGVVGDVRVESLSQSPRQALYVPFGVGALTLTLVIKTSGEPMRLVEPVQPADPRDRCGLATAAAHDDARGGRFLDLDAAARRPLALGVRRPRSPPGPGRHPWRRGLHRPPANARDRDPHRPDGLQNVASIVGPRRLPAYPGEHLDPWSRLETSLNIGGGRALRGVEVAGVFGQRTALEQTVVAEQETRLPGIHRPAQEVVVAKESQVVAAEVGQERDGEIAL